jgi:lysozyme
VSEAQAEAIAAAFIKKREGLRLTAYNDGTGVWTIGYGHTSGLVKEGDTITLAQANQYLAMDIQWAIDDVKQFVHVVLNPNQFAALISFEFNTGAGSDSGVYENINSGNFSKAMDVLQEWVTDGNGNVIEGLVNRRLAERELFESK